MRISELSTRLRERGFRTDTTGPDAEVTGATSDSRRVAAGDIFVALPGARTDGARFTADALAAGAVAVACIPGGAPPDAPALLVDDIARAAGHLASLVYGEPGRTLELVGVTGTNGKTSCTYLLESIWLAAGIDPGVIGTVSVRWSGHEETAAMTTPAASDLQRALAAMIEAGVAAAAVEISSHALSQHRAAGCAFDAAIFTNLTRDHLDYHGDAESYFEAKASLFLEHLAADGVAVLNADDSYAMRIANRLEAAQVRTFSTEHGASTYAHVRDVKIGLEGIDARVALGADEIRVDTCLVGLPNLANVLAAAAAAHARGIAVDAIEAGIHKCRPVPGRLERVGSALPVVFVDYAHTPDALERTLATARTLARGRLIVAFGCGGDRDRGKRPMMGAIAARGADVCVLTSDNPRSEEPAAIVAEIEAGVDGIMPESTFERLADPKAHGYAVEVDRERAIEAALALASPDDVVVIAGKGHETYQEVAGVRRHFDDREVVARLRPAAAARTS